MLCEQAQPLLQEYSRGELAPALRAELSAHLDTCATCQADLAEVHAADALLTQWAASWQTQSPRPWTPPAIAPTRGGNYLDGFRLWFPTLASALALAMVTVLFVQQPGERGTLPVAATGAEYAQLPPLPQATKAAMVQSVLEDSRDERGQEIQALLKILKAEMDKRSIETEESLRYIISHQIKGQQELDELYAQVEALMTEDHPTIERHQEVSP